MRTRQNDRLKRGRRGKALKIGRKTSRPVVLGVGCDLLCSSRQSEAMVKADEHSKSTFCLRWASESLHVGFFPFMFGTLTKTDVELFHRNGDGSSQWDAWSATVVATETLSRQESDPVASQTKWEKEEKQTGQSGTRLKRADEWTQRDLNIRSNCLSVIGPNFFCGYRIGLDICKGKRVQAIRTDHFTRAAVTASL